MSIAGRLHHESVVTMPTTTIGRIHSMNCGEPTLLSTNSAVARASAPVSMSWRVSTPRRPCSQMITATVTITATSSQVEIAATSSGTGPPSSVVSSTLL